MIGKLVSKILIAPQVPLAVQSVIPVPESAPQCPQAQLQWPRSDIEDGLALLTHFDWSN